MKNNLTYGRVADLFPRPGTILIADDWFRGRGIVEAWRCPTLWVHASEEEKTFATVERLVAELLALEADRSTMLVGVGGGIVTDITGFVAAIYKRGVPFGLVPTTLLAQVDAAIGGKNGVNFDRFKNMVGTFREPAFVYIDTDFLKTLPERALRCGAAEMLKTFLLADARAYETAVAVFSGPHPADVPDTLVRRAGEIKLGIVEQDPEDHGDRQLLNLGHTFGHAIEKCTSQYAHGEAVAIGISMAARLACEKGLLAGETAGRIVRDLAACGLPVEPPVPEAELRAAILQDKKRMGQKLRFVLPVDIGKAILWDASVSA